MRYLGLILVLILFNTSSSFAQADLVEVNYAEHFEVQQLKSGVKLLKVKGAWPNSTRTHTYALIPKEHPELKEEYRTYPIIEIPVKRVVLSSTTHIPAVVELGEVASITGFTGMEYISSKEVRKRINQGHITELGMNEKVNIEATIALNPEVFIGFSVNGSNKAYDELKQFGIPIVFNADWVETTPLAKAEWIKFFGLFYGKEQLANQRFKEIETQYIKAKQIAQKAATRPTVISGSLYKDVWYAPGKDSWGASFIRDANAKYLFDDLGASGSLSLSIEEAILKGHTADYWISPSQYTSYESMKRSNKHYEVFKAFKDKRVFTYALTKGETGGMLYYELASQRPDLVLKDLIAIFHPQLLKDYKPTFFKSLIHD